MTRKSTLALLTAAALVAAPMVPAFAASPMKSAPIVADGAGSLAANAAAAYLLQAAHETGDQQ